MFRDIRDPQEIGAALAAQRAHSPSEPICSLADRILAHSTIRHYGETDEQYAKRTLDANTATNGQLAMFRAA